MARLSAGVLLYRLKNGAVEVFLVHPGGPFWAKKDDGAWSIPKGEYGVQDDAWEAARREFKEETGYAVPGGEMLELGEVSYSGKRLVAWALQGTIDAERIQSNTVAIEWPPKSGKQAQFPEVDRAGWFDAAEAQRKLVKGQVPLIGQLFVALGMPQPRPVDADGQSSQMTLF